jgi:3-methylcrotonyl-CoA carboxylase alpha subunit
MNTRLQVEHPITEMVTGCDLVELQIKVASGENLEISQKDIKQTGHAIECRIYAEDPDNEFLPSVGVLGYIGPKKLEGVRFDSGFEKFNEVTINFDPMLAKIITFATDRDQAIAKMKNALNQYLFCGVKTNRDYLKRILSNNDFILGNTLTSFIPDHADELNSVELTDEIKAKIIASLIYKNSNSSNSSSWNKLSNYRNF